MDYEKILKGIVQIINTTEKSDIGFANICTYIGENCPELAESEDERIRKELIEHIKANCESDFILFQKFSPDDVIAWLEEQAEQKPIDKVEPKFKVGDWVVWDNKIYCHVDNIYQGKESLMYTITDAHNMTRSYSVKGFDNNARLWTIQDAKDGDVLKEDSCIFIIERMKPDGIAIVHCCLFDDGDFDLGSTLVFDVDSTYPATKEQRDHLFAKMREAGYEWDEENREPKKIEQKDSTEEISGNLRGISPNSKWSEEDEKCIDNCCLLIGAADDCYEKTFKDDCIHYLQSLKERIAWKPMPIKQKDIDDLVFDFKWSSENFKNKRVTDIYRQGIYDVMELLKQRMGG